LASPLPSPFFSFWFCF